MRLNSKGQVTIPAQLRAKHNLCEGDDIEIIEVDDTFRSCAPRVVPLAGNDSYSGCAEPPTAETSKV